MNWPLFWALLLAFGVVIGNIMLIRHAAKVKMPVLTKKPDTEDEEHDIQDNAGKPTQTGENSPAKTSSDTTRPDAKKPSNPE